MADHFAGRGTPASSRIAELHQLCDQDYAKGQAQRARAARAIPSYDPFATASAIPAAPEPDDLDAAIHIAQQALGSDQLVPVREALRLLLRALHAEPPTPHPAAPRCPAAHVEDPTGCDGPPVVTVIDRTNAGADGCAHHAARLLASIDGGRVYALPGAPKGTATAVFKAADSIRPYPWADGPRTRPGQLSRAENRQRGEGK